MVTQCNQGQGVNPMGSPNFWEYGSPVDYSSPKPYQTPGEYQTPFPYSPSSDVRSDTNTSLGGGTGWGTGGRGGGRGGGGDNRGGTSRGDSSGSDDGERGKRVRRVGWIVACFYACLGMIGFLIANSTASLVGGLMLSLPFVTASALMELNLILGVSFGLTFGVLVFGYCLKKYLKSRKLVPAGALLAFSSWTLYSYVQYLLL